MEGHPLRRASERQSLEVGDTAVLLVDYQEKLFSAMPEKARERHLKNTKILLEGAQALKIPVIATEQYPKGIGPTLPQVRESYPDLNPIEKMEFSCLKNETASKAIQASGKRKFLVTGMETHICVYQTVLDLVDKGFIPHVVADTCLSRTEENYRVGLSLCEKAGAVITGTETALFQLLGKAGGEEFKKISKLIR
ncbi:MAG: hydrolase [Bdellovibrionota bacterium]